MTGNADLADLAEKEDGCLSAEERVEAQRILNTVVAHLRKQAGVSIAQVNGKTSCAYRAWDGASKCGLGALITDEHYYPSLEGYGPTRAEVFDVIKKSGWKVESWDMRWFLNDVQKELHDSYVTDPHTCTYLEMLEAGVVDICKTHGLEVPPAQ